MNRIETAQITFKPLKSGPGTNIQRKVGKIPAGFWHLRGHFIGRMKHYSLMLPIFVPINIYLTPHY